LIELNWGKKGDFYTNPVNNEIMNSQFNKTIHVVKIRIYLIL
jgi:hypothetical protein